MHTRWDKAHRVECQDCHEAYLDAQEDIKLEQEWEDGIADS